MDTPKISLLYIEGLKLNLASSVEKHVENVFSGFSYVRGFVSRDVLSGSFNPARRQYYSTIILRNLKEYTHKMDAEKFLLIVDVDLYVPRLNFVFGEALFPGKFAVVSVFRLKPEFYGAAADDLLLLSRLKKEVIHELGHTFGLSHCENPKCVMYFSNSIIDTDNKLDTFCSACNLKLLRLMEGVR